MREEGGEASKGLREEGACRRAREGLRERMGEISKEREGLGEGGTEG